MSNNEGSSNQKVHSNHDTTIIIPGSVDILLESVKSENSIDKFSPIYTVPSRLRAINPSSFTPRVVSIGPIHRGRPSLKLMEDKKSTYLKELLKAVDESETSWENILTRCHTNVSNSIKEIKRYYFGEYFEQKKYLPEDGGIDEEFTRMMVLDACFMLQFMNKLFQRDDTLYHDNRLRSRSVAVDLVLLENQIPYSVLKDIYDSTFGTIKPSYKYSLIDMLYELLERVNPFHEKLKKSTVENPPPEAPKEPRYHILGVLHEFYRPYQIFEPPKIAVIPTAHSVIELHKVGVRFRPNKNRQTNKQTKPVSEIPPEIVESGENATHSGITGVEYNSKGPQTSRWLWAAAHRWILHKTVERGKNEIIEDRNSVEAAPESPPSPMTNKNKNWLMAMEFERCLHKPIFRMPKVLIDNFFEVIMRNLIAYEQYSTPVRNYVTSYAMAMDMLVATPEDIAKLTKLNIIQNNLGSNKKASKLISSICQDVTFPDFYYIDSWEKAKVYYDSWSKIPWVFTREYCSTPWKAIALLAAIIIFSLTVIQFVFRMTRFKAYLS